MEDKLVFIIGTIAIFYFLYIRPKIRKYNNSLKITEPEPIEEVKPGEELKVV